VEFFPLLRQNIYTMSRKRGLNKSKVGFSVDIELVKELDEYCEENYMNKSKIVNDLLKRFLESKKIKDNGN